MQSDISKTKFTRQTMYEKEARILLDYSCLGEHHKELDDSDDVKKMETKMQKHINELMNTIQRIQVSYFALLANLTFLE